MNLNKKDELVYFTFPEFEKYPFITHAFSSRLGGISEGMYYSLNLGFNCSDKYENVYQNYKIFCTALDINQDDLVFGMLTHDSNVRIVTSSDKGKGILYKPDYFSVDALITNEPKVPLVTTYADCVPIFFLDPINKVVAIAHSGWRGTVKKIGENVINTMLDYYRCDIKNILIGIAPSIGHCCFEVSEEVYMQFNSMDCLSKEKWYTKLEDKYYIDMWKVIKSMFLKLGILESNISITDLCTKCNSDLFFSHRATNGKRGCLCGVIQLN